MKHSALTLAFSALLLGATLLHAKPVKTEVSNKDNWTVNSYEEDGKFVRSEMIRTYNGKHEVHLRIGFDGETFNIDATADWSELPDAKSHAATYRFGSKDEEPYLKKKAKVVEDADGLTWLRVSEPNQPGIGDALANTDKLLINVGPEGKEVVWEFDLKGSNAAFKAMAGCYTGAEEEPAAGEKISEEEAKALVEQEEPAADGDEEPLIEHEYARPGDWGVHWFTKGKSDAFAQASMIRYYDDASMLRMTIDATHFHLDVAADWAVLGTTKWKKGAKVKVSVQLAEQADLEPGKEIAILVDDEGDKWLRISQPLDEPSGMQDAVRNGKKLHIVFPSKAKWTFDLKGSHAAWQKVDECMEKHNK